MSLMTAPRKQELIRKLDESHDCTAKHSCFFACGLSDVLLLCRSSKEPSKAAGPPLDQLPAGELARKLADSQQMIARFSRENERLANQNEQLTGSKQIVANDYKGGNTFRPHLM